MTDEKAIKEWARGQRRRFGGNKTKRNMTDVDGELVVNR